MGDAVNKEGGAMVAVQLKEPLHVCTGSST
jgi:hypothetical protein